MIVVLTGCYRSYPLMVESDGSSTPDSPEALTDPTPDPATDHHDTAPPDLGPDSSSDTSWDASDIAAYDISYDLGPTDATHDGLPPVPASPTCGDGTLDPGEECDDRNRLDGDGCDWLCRLGDGDPPPPPEDIPAYEPTGPPVVLPGFDGSGPWSLERLPLVWTGSEYAVAVMARHEDGSRTIRMRRFERDGTPRGPDWVFDLKSILDGVDLAWTGSEYGLFFHDQYRGIYLLRVSATGEPVGQPINVEPDPQARAPAADVTSTGYVLAWITEGDVGTGTITSWCGDWGGPADTIRVRLVGFDGSISGAPVMVEDLAGGPPDVATGSGGYGITAMVNSSTSFPSCALRFVRLSADLSTATYSGILSDGEAGDVVWEDGRYIVGWGHWDTMSGGIAHECVARFHPDGSLEGPPACNDLGTIEDPCYTRIAAGDHGLALVFTRGFSELAFLRTGLNGIAVADPYGFSAGFNGPYNTVWAVDGFGVGVMSYGMGLMLWTFEAVD